MTALRPTIMASKVGPTLNNFTLAGGTQTFDLAGTDAVRAADGRAVQLALWSMIGETSINGELAGNAMATALKNWYTTNVAEDGNYYSVGIANLVTASGQNVQDQFVVVPEASTIAIWSLLSLCGLAVYRRRVRN